ncbi:MAG: glycosyltransferase [Solirubrobacteraceae bacterium]
MRLLHVGDDFAGLRPCGLTLYVAALMEAQAAQGHEVAYVFSGRHYPRLERPRLKRWNSGAVKMFELIGSPSHAHWDGTRNPAMDLQEPVGEATFAAAVRAVRPEIVHIHELSRLPSSVIEHAKAAGLPVVMTLHDYKPLCASVRLLDADGERCMRRDVGEDCARNCAGVPGGRAHLIDRTLGYEFGRLKQAIPLARQVNFSSTAPLVAHASALLHRAPAEGSLSETGPAPAADYQRRRDVNAERLGLCDRLIAPSRRVAEIYAALGVDRQRLSVQRLTLPHLEGLRPSASPAVGTPMTFATLGGCASTAKGARSVVEAALALERDGHGSKYRLVVHGLVDEEATAELTQIPSVSIAGPYDPGDLESLLQDADVGVLPSMWEEAHGFAGVEMLARGLPVIGTAFGGIPEYVREGETGWLNHSGSGAELADLMLAAINDRDEVLRLRRSVRALNDEFARPMSVHVAEVQELYAELTSETATR